MIFWYLLTIISIILFVIICGISKKRKIIVLLYLFVLWFVSAFRYMIGQDTYSYVITYESVGATFDVVSKEPVFEFLVYFLNKCGFSAQMLLLVYATIILSFLYKGIKFYFNDYRYIYLFLLLYYLHINCYQMSLTGIRQSAAISILFWGSQFIVKRKFFKYVLALSLAIINHYSAAVFFFLYWIPQKYLKKKWFLFGVGVSLISLNIKLLPRLFITIINVADLETSYIGYAMEMVNDGRVLISFWNIVYVGLLLFTLLFYRYDYESKNIYLYNTSLVFVFIILLTSYKFTNTAASDMMGRLSYYLVVPFIAMLTRILMDSYLKSKTVVLLLLSLSIFSTLNIYILYSWSSDPVNVVSPSLSAGNYNYEFNFNLLK